MAEALIGLAWATVVVVARLRCRPLPHRRLDQAQPRSGPGWTALTSPWWPAVEVLGRAVLRLRPGERPRPRREPAQAAARRAGAVALAAAATAATLPVLTPAVVFGGWAWPRLRERREERRRLARVEAGLPEVVDLLALAVGAGANVSHAVAAAGRRGVGPLAAELARITGEVGRGRRVADALDELPDRAGEAVRPLTTALSTCERYGAPLGPTLERLADDVRRQRQRRAEEAARKVPVALLFPLVLCILPAFALLTVAPLVAGALRALRL